MNRSTSSVIGLLFGIGLWALLFLKSGVMGLIMIGLLPFMVLAVAGFIRFPKVGLYAVLIFSFFVGFLNRLIPGVPFGLMVDGILVITGLGILFYFWRGARLQNIGIRPLCGDLRAG